MEYKRIIVHLEKELELIYCESCGVLVFDTEAHDGWHKGYGEIASSARNADMMTRPIGPGPGVSLLEARGVAGLPEHLIKRAEAARKKAAGETEL